MNFAYVADTTGTPAGESTLFVNGLDFTVNPAPTGAPGRLGLAGVGLYPLEVSDADVSEIVIYDRVLSATELTEVRDFLYTKYRYDAVAPGPNQYGALGNPGTFTGGDPGEGLDMQGSFVHAINVGGPGGLTVGDAVFTDGSEAGMAAARVPVRRLRMLTKSSAGILRRVRRFAQRQRLETVMESIRWNTPPGVNVDLAVTPGQPYKVQLLFAEQCCNRGFDITIEGELVADNFNVQVTQEGINNGALGVVYTRELTAQDDVLNILLGGIQSLGSRQQRDPERCDRGGGA